jgi:segregation and condensation protein A
MPDHAYRVRLESFEGPLDLLLHLVKTNELDLYNLPIAVITDQYLQYLDMFEELNLDVAGEYLVMAATLMYLKSRLLLPLDEDDDEEEQEDPAADLVRQLAEYQRYREAAEELRDRALLGRDVFRRVPSPPERAEGEETPFQPVELADLFEALQRVLKSTAARKPHVLEGEEFSVADAVRSMVARLGRVERLPFAELFGSDATRGLIISTFVGLLELIKMGIVEAEQQGRGPIQLRLVDSDSEAAIAQLVETYGQARHPSLDGEGSAVGQ